MEDPFNRRGDELNGQGRALIKAEVTSVDYARPYPYAPVGTFPVEEGDDISVTLRQYLYLVVKRRRLILRTALACFALGVVLTLLQTRLYSATVRIEIEREPAKIVAGEFLSRLILQVAKVF